MKICFQFFLIVSLLLAQSKRIIALRVEFQGDKSEFTSGAGKFDLRSTLTPDSIENIVIDPPPHNRSYFSDHLTFARNYFKKTLAVDIDFLVYPVLENKSYLLSKPMFYYNPNTERDSLEGIVKLYTESYELAEKDEVSIQKDDIVIIFHAGVGNDIYKIYNNTPNDIPSLSLTRKLIERYKKNWLGNNRTSKGIILPETASQEGLNLAINGLVVANIGTQLGFLDLLDPVAKGTVVGPWALEDRGLFNAAGLLPSVPSVFNGLLYKKKIDSMPFTKVNSKKTNYKVSYVENPKKAYKFAINKNEYFLIGARYRPIFNSDKKLNLDTLILILTPNGREFLNYKELLRHKNFSHRSDFIFSQRGVLINTNYFDAAIPHSGILIWHVDHKIVQTYTESNSINQNKIYRGIYFLEADGINNYQTNGDGNNNERYDIFYASNKWKYYQNKIDDTSFPSTSSNYEKAKSGIRISNFSSIAKKMSFDISRTDIFFETFPHSLETLFVNQDTIYITKIIEDTLCIYSKAISDEKFVKKIAIDTRFTNTHATILTETVVLSFDQNRLIRFDRMKQKIDSVYNLSTDILALFLNDKDVFIQAKAKEIFCLKDLLLEKKFMEVDKIYSTEAELIFNSDNNFYKFESSKFVKVNLSNNFDALIKVNSLVYGAKHDANIISVYNEKDALLNEFPIEIPYRNDPIELDSIFSYSNYIVSIDKKNIIKITALYPKDNNNVSVYTGFKPRVIRFSKSNQGNYILVIGESTYFQEKITFPKQERKNSFATTSGILNKDRTFVWPNPNNGYKMNIRISLNSNELVTLRIFTEIGLFIKEEKFRVQADFPFDYKLPITELESGTYIIQVKVKAEEKILKAAVIR